MRLHLILATQNALTLLLVLGIPLALTTEVLGVEKKSERTSSAYESELDPGFVQTLDSEGFIFERIYSYKIQDSTQTDRQETEVKLTYTQLSKEYIQTSISTNQESQKFLPFQATLPNLSVSTNSAFVLDGSLEDHTDISQAGIELNPQSEASSAQAYTVLAGSIAKYNYIADQKFNSRFSAELTLQSESSLSSNVKSLDGVADISPFSNQNQALNIQTALSKSSQDTQKLKVLPSLNSLLEEGERQVEEGQYDKAESIFTEALHQAETVGDSLGIARALSGKAVAELGSKRYAEAQEFSVQALMTLRKTNQSYPEVEADILLCQGYAYLGQEKKSELENLVKQITPIIFGLNISEKTSGILVGLADLQYALGQKELGNQSAQKAVNFLQENPDPSGTIAILSRLAVSQYTSDKPEETVKTLGHLSELITKLKENTQKIGLRRAIGGIYLKLAGTESLQIKKTDRERELFEKARQSFDAAWTISPQEDKTEENAKILLGLSRAYLGLRRNEEAVTQAEQALTIIQELEKGLGIQEPRKKRRSLFEQIGCGVERALTHQSRCDEEDAELALLNQPDTIYKQLKRDARNVIAAARLDQERYTESGTNLREALEITRELDNKLTQVSKTLRQIQGFSGIISWIPIGFVSEIGSSINTAATAFDQGIALPQGVASLLNKINNDLLNSSKRHSLEELEKKRKDAHLQKDIRAEAESLLQLGSVYLGISRYDDAGRAFKDAATLFKQLSQTEQINLNDSKLWIGKEVEALLGSGRSLFLERKYSEAQTIIQQAKDISEQESNLLGLGNAWLTLGNIDLAQGKLSKAEQSLQKALHEFVDAADGTEVQLGKANTFLALGTVALKQHKYKSALEQTEVALGIFQTTRNELESARARLVRGSAYQALGNHKLALEEAQKALFVFKDLGDRIGEISALNNIGDALQSQRRYEQAIKFYGLSAELQKDLQKNIQKPKPKTGWLINVFRVSGFFLPMIGTLGQVGMKIYDALSLAQNIVYLSESAVGNLGLGNSYLSLGDYEQAIKAFDEVRKASENQDPQKEAEALLGLTNTRLSFNRNYDMARQDADRAVNLFNSIGDRIGAAYALLSQGIAYNHLGNSQSDLQNRAQYYSKAFNTFEQAISIFQDSENLDSAGEAKTYSALGDLLMAQGQEGGATLFYKKSIQITERIRQELPDGRLGRAYIGNIVDTYRRLIELLLSQRRIPEAQQVLELLRLEEINAVSTRATVKKDGSITLTDLEHQALGQYKQFITLSQELTRCGSDCSINLKNRRTTLINQYDKYMELLQAEVNQRRNSDGQVFSPKLLNTQAKKIVDPCEWLSNQRACTPAESHLKTMLIYPFVGEDKGDPNNKYKLWLLWASAKGIAVAFEQSIDRKKFEETVFEFYDLLSNPNNLNRRKDLEIVSGKLYDWLIRPLEKEMEGGEINNLVFVLDRFIRYLPMAALLDSKTNKYLIQKGYQVSTVISANETNVGDLLGTKNVAVLAMGLADVLPNVRPEISGIVYAQGAKSTTASFPGLALYDKDFTVENLQKNLEKYRILHLATHGVFSPKTDEESYLMLAGGNKLTPTLIKSLAVELTSVHLVVLSACQTGLGGLISKVDDRRKAEGVEISSLSYAFMEGDRAKAVVASLWAVNDASTARLMQLFYANLANTKEPMTKSEALRRAQLSLLIGKSDPVNTDGTRSNFNIPLPPNADKNLINRDLSHPYYWAPFILIGNGL